MHLDRLLYHLNPTYMFRPESHTKQTTQLPTGPIFTSILHHDFLLNTWPSFLNLITLFLNNFTWYFITTTLKMADAGRNM
jgi:hypothetical protein